MVKTSGLLAGLLLLLTVSVVDPGAADDTVPLTVSEILALQELGFDEAEIQSVAIESRTELDNDDIEELRGAGFSAAFLHAVGPVLTDDDIARLSDDGWGAEGILEAIRDARADFDTSPQALLTLARTHELPPSVSRAMRGRPLTLDDFLLLGARKTSADEFVLLLDILGTQAVSFDADTVLQMKRSGVPNTVLARLRDMAEGQASGADVETVAIDNDNEAEPAFVLVGDWLVSGESPIYWRIGARDDEVVISERKRDGIDWVPLEIADASFDGEILTFAYRGSDPETRYVLRVAGPGQLDGTATQTFEPSNVDRVICQAYPDTELCVDKPQLKRRDIRLTRQ